MKRHVFILLLSFAGVLTSAFAASRQVQGVVISSEDNMPLIGASVYIKAEDLSKDGNSPTITGVITDIDGKFNISVPEGVTRLFCSYVGHEVQELKLVPGKDQYEITLFPSAQMLDAVVVTGYQTVERRKLTAAVGKLNISDETIGAVKSIDQALAGQIAGLSVTSTSGAPGAPAKIRIRGTSSLNGTQDPLWVLDGIPLEGTDVPQSNVLNDVSNIQQSSIAGLNPADIENITVLKDAAATAIYGARAANGVIVITTKKGKVGKPVINFSSKFTYMPTLSTNRLNMLNSQEKVDLELELLRSNFAYGDNKGGVSKIISGYGLTDAYKKGGWSALTPEAQTDISRLRNTETDWGDILFRDAFNQEYSLSLSGGNERVTYYTSIGYYQENGNVKGVGLDRLNIVAKTSYKVNRMLKFGVSLFVNRRNNKTYLTDTYGLVNPVYYSRKANPYYQPFDVNGNYVYDFDVQNNSDTDLGFNIFEERKNTSNEETINALSSIFDAELRFNDKLKFTTQLGLQLDKASKEQIADKESFSMRIIRKNSKYWDSASQSNKYFIPDGGVHKAYENTNSQITWKAMGEYRDSFNDIHELEVMVGTELRKTWYETLFSAGYGFDRQTLTTKPVVFPDEDRARQFPLHQKTYKENAYVSFFSTASYSLMNRYTFGGSIRFDGSDLFGVDKKYRYLPLYSVSGLWRLSNEPFMQGTRKWMDNLAFRVSYGIQGNIDKNTSPFLLGKYIVDNILPGGSEHMIDINSAPNKKLRWEKTQSVNVGLDFSVLNQALNLSVDYYYRKGTDLIGKQMLPLETGFVSTNINWASMVNKGVEVSLSTRNVATKNFSWYTNLNFAYNNNKVLREAIPEAQTIPGREGYPVDAIFAIKTAGLDEEGYPLFYDKEGKKVTLKELYRLQDPFGLGFTVNSDVTPAEERSFYSYIGSQDTPYTGGLINTFSYKNWELTANLSFNLGGYVRTTPSYNFINFDRGQNVNSDILDRWTPENTDGRLPALITSEKRADEYYWYDQKSEIYKNLDIWVKKLNYFRLQNLRLGYRLPEKMTKSLGMGSASVAIEGRNLLVFGSSYKNFLDPESMYNPYAPPIPKSITFSLNLNF
ncbi:SusC/RagA family TonB-linked outer membrane protein [Bacteroides fragilis]|jgi:tonB-linked outer membrane protein, susC/ragA family|uniref:SusC/RagA family TonB-linked outer membrane protein n=1 Tax=Bacteroides fragilis TaxID=817 RepID=UPI00044EF966|nr:SusC/RagA family TonB-linked outer membrane protein [Bacteroides fragilis]EXZ89177.1 tonB-linked outer membrane, SusC/RagA family protein [Bacteroides fragilis str. J38-1]KAA4746112.1 SusC/RagA family TonB-linked outer membrane protein [Bacteroides fragilis]KAA4765201.1 SusC/RagA family TonB-linked outer membrane protein [Bacteroides fragilis]KAA4768595.1 SusC/RagA family TonB-linked outer membrane protein [Bacteroides fragilis]KAA4769908.1 SusC/RagA family TonB-linked outer membrane protei